MPEIYPFKVAVSDEVLEDLQQRLTHTRWPEAETVDDWTQGGASCLRDGAGRLLARRIRLA